MKKILVIEDDIVVNETLCDILENAGYQVESALNGYEGIKIAKHNILDLIICDVNMPVMNGFETVKKIKTIEDYILTPFLFLSALSDQEQIRKGMHLGADDYLCKPFDHNTLLTSIQQLLNKYELIKNRITNELDMIKNPYNLISFQSYEDKLADHIQGMNYASLIQNSILPKKNQLQKLFPDYGLFHSPKDIVSGDFYWARKVGANTLVAVGDCTGHGVAGALLSMVCSNILSFCVDYLSLTSPAEILEKSNDLLLKQQGIEENIITNGMDIVLCSINKENKTITYAGANRPLYIVSEKLDISNMNLEKINKIDLGDKKLFRIKSGSMAIGSKEGLKEISDSLIHYKKDDIIYLTTDGYNDQFGGQSQKKYGYKRFVDLIEYINSKPSYRQEYYFRNSYLKWKGYNDQTDDVTVFIIKL